eukprot:5193528-Alexandrium_andersonii.AAC.1
MERWLARLVSITRAFAQDDPGRRSGDITSRPFQEGTLHTSHAIVAPAVAAARAKKQFGSTLSELVRLRRDQATQAVQGTGGLATVTQAEKRPRRALRGPI